MTTTPCHEVKILEANGASKTVKVPVIQELVHREGDLLPSPEGFTWTAPSNTIPPPSVPIPAIDMMKLQPGAGSEDRDEELRELSRAAKEWGMFMVKNHGIPSEVLNDLRDVVKGFFRLSFEEKKASVGLFSTFDNTGYGRNYVRSECLDWHDRLSIKASPKDSTQGLTIWPQNPPHFRSTMEKYVEGARKMMDDLLRALAECLSQDREAFVRHFDEKRSQVNLKVNYYPPCPRPDLALGLGGHTDGSALTTVIQFENSGGFQVYKDGKWLSPEWPVGEIVINVGDLVEILSNGEFESPWHRVATQKVERWSVAMFYLPPNEVEIVPAVVEAEESGNNGGRFKKVLVEDYVHNFYRVNPSATKEAIKFAHI